MRTPIHRSFYFALLSLLSPGPAWGQAARLDGYEIPAYLQFSSPSYQASESQTNAAITVIRTGEFREPVSVKFATQDGTAHAGVDYTPVSGTLNIPAGVGIASFLVPVHPNALRASPATVHLKIFGPSPNGLILRGDAALTLAGSTVPPSRPALKVRTDGQGRVFVSWPATTATCVLERSGIATGGGWVGVDAIPEVADGTCTVTEAALAGQFFYRLKQP